MFWNSHGYTKLSDNDGDALYKEIEEKFKGYRVLENYIRITKLINSASAFVFIYVFLFLYQIHLFKEKYRLDVARFIELAALLVCAVGLATCFFDASIYHQKQKLRKEVDERIDELGRGELQCDKKSPAQSKKDRAAELETLKTIQKSLKPESRLSLFIRGCGFVSALIFVVMECIAVTHLYKPFDFYPPNIGGIVDSTAISIGLLSSALLLASKVVECISSRKKGADEEQKVSLSQLITPTIAFAATIVNLSGRLLQTLSGEDPALGTGLRMFATIVLMGILIHSVTKDLNDHVSSNLKVTSYESMNRQTMALGADGGS